MHHMCALLFLARDSIYAIARYMPSPVRLSVRLSVCLSVCHTGGTTAKRLKIDPQCQRGNCSALKVLFNDV